MKRTPLLLLLLFPIALLAQTGTIEGIVTDKISHDPLAGITVGIENAHKTEASDEFGKFHLRNLRPGIYRLQFSGIGYDPALVSVEVKENKTTKLTATLATASLDLEEIIITGKRNSMINTIAAVDIKLRPVNTSQDILRIVPGLFIAQHAGGGKADQLFLRGYDIDHGTDIAETVDGMPVNMVSHAHGQGYADLHFIIPELVEKVDFDKGPYQTSKGNLATAGWVDFKTKDFLNSNVVKIEEGSFHYKRALGLFRILNRETEKQHRQFYIGTEFFKTDSYFDAPQNFHRFNLFGKYSAQFRNNSQLFITASTFDSKWKASGQVPERAVESGMISRFGSIDNSEGGYTARTNINVKFAKLWKSGWKTADQVYFSNYHFSLYSNFTFFLKDSVNGDEINQRENRNLLGYTGTANKDFYVRNKRWNTEFGYGFRYDNVSGIELNHVAKRNFLEHVEQGAVKEINGFVFAGQTVDLGRSVQLNAGLRYDHFSFGYKNRLAGEQRFSHQSKGILSPKLNLVFNFSKTATLTFSSGLGFHSNDARVILDRQATDILPNVFGTDISLLLKPARQLLLKTTFWQLRSQQEFVYVGDEGVVEPAGRTQRIGIDFSARYQPLSWLYLDLDINATKPRALDEAKGNNYVPLAPVFTSIGGLTIKNKKGFSGSLRYRQMSNRPANEDNSSIATGYFIADALAAYSFRKFDLSLSIENLFNSEWREAQFDTESKLKNEAASVAEIHYTPGTPRFFKAGIAFNF
jgi:hypothetical protein